MSLLIQFFLKKKWCLDLRHGGSAAGHRAGKFDWQEKKQRRAVLVLDCRERGRALCFSERNVWSKWSFLLLKHIYTPSISITCALFTPLLCSPRFQTFGSRSYGCDVIPLRSDVSLLINQMVQLWFVWAHPFF